MSRETFRDLFEAHKGKVSDKWDLYLSVYEKVLAHLRNDSISLLEIGVQNGGSLEVWASYFPQANTIVGVDVDPNCASLQFDDSRISVVLGDAKNLPTRQAIEARSQFYNVIIDDGSHVSSDIVANFFQLLPLLTDSGLYIVEDMHASYWKELGGELFAPYSAASFFKTLTDVLNYEHWSLDKPPADLLRPFADHVHVDLPMHHLERIESITFLNSVCIVRKTSGEPTALGPRQIAGTESTIAAPARFPVEAFARKAELNHPGDYFWAWQPRPPMETLAEQIAASAKQAEALAASEASVREYAGQLKELRDRFDALQTYIARQDRELQFVREENISLKGTLGTLESTSARAAAEARLGQQERDTLSADIHHVRQQLNELVQQLGDARDQATLLGQQLALLHESTSWRLTYPLRYIKRLGRFLWHAQAALRSSAPFLTTFAFRLFIRMLTEPDLAEAAIRRIYADPDTRSRIQQMGRLSPAQYAVLDAFARRLEHAYRLLRKGVGKLRRSRLGSGSTKAARAMRKNGLYFHLDNPVGILVPTRGSIVFRGWALDVNLTDAADLRITVAGRSIRVDRYKRGDVITAFSNRLSRDAKAAFEASVRFSGRAAWITIELAVAPGRWTVVHRALLLLVGSREPGALRESRTYEPAAWRNVLQTHVAEQLTEMREHIAAFPLRPAFLVVIDARKHVGDLEKTLVSLGNQLYPADQIAVLGASEDLVNTESAGMRVRHALTLTLTDATFAGLSHLLLLEPGDQLTPTALYEFASTVIRVPGSAMIYADESFPTSSSVPLPFYKPDWSPDYLESFDYVGHGAVFLMSRARDLFLPLDSIYDFTLRFTEMLDGNHVVHLPKLLLERGAPFDRQAADDDTIAAIQGRLDRTGRTGDVVPAASGTNCHHARIRWPKPPDVSIVIPTAGYTKSIDGRNVDLIANITEQIVERSSYRAVEIIVVDNGDLTDRQRSHLERLGCRRITFQEQAFNVAKKLNLGASIANGEFLLLMNDDMEIIQPDWIERLCDHLAKPDVGVVGCRLLYPDRTTQHVGVIHYYGNPDHVRRGYPADDAGYFNSTCGVRNYIAVTGACMLTRTSLYHQVGGYTPKLAVSYNDADYCLKARAAGYRVVYTGDAELIHMESLSRVPSANPDEVRYYQDRWTPKLPEDPYYSERFLALAPPSFEPRTNDRVL